MFFVYGGLTFPADAIGELSKQISRIRNRRNFGPTDSFKFRSSSRPRAIDQEEFKRAKAEVMQACSEHGAKLVVTVIHHQIMKARSDTSPAWQINTCLDELQRRLAREGEHAFVVMDRFGNKKRIRPHEREVLSGWRYSHWHTKRILAHHRLRSYS